MTRLMLLVAIAILLLIGNWFFSESLVLLPLEWIISFCSSSWWAVALVAVAFFAWCIGED
ncbi:MAG: hypothetical protein AAFQ80_08650 [Cyanobacteria bacterium J06621_8]